MGNARPDEKSLGRAGTFLSMESVLKLRDHSAPICTKTFLASVNGHSHDDAVCLSGDTLSISTIPTLHGHFCKEAFLWSSEGSRKI